MSTIVQILVAISNSLFNTAEEKATFNCCIKPNGVIYGAIVWPHSVRSVAYQTRLLVFNYFYTGFSLSPPAASGARFYLLACTQHRMFPLPASPIELKMFSVTSRMRSVASPWRPIGVAPLAYCLMCWSRSLRA